MEGSGELVLFRQTAVGKVNARAPGVIRAGHELKAAPTVMHRFSFARSPAGGLARLAFWLGRDEFSGEVSRSGGYAPLVPGGAKRFGDGTSGSTMAGAVSVGWPSAQGVTPGGQPLWSPLCMEPATSTL